MQNQVPQDLVDILIAEGVRLDKIEQALTNDAVPVGAEFNWPASNSLLPFNYMACNGAAIDRIGYAALFAAIGTTYGVGDGSSTFNIPNRTGSGIFIPTLPSWTSVTYAGTWVAAGAPFSGGLQYWKDPNGLVYLQGVSAKGGNNWVASETVCTLPVGYRPLIQKMFNSHVVGGGAGSDGAGRLDITTGGAVTVVTGAATNPVVFLGLDGIVFDSGVLPTPTASQTGNWVIKVL